MQKKGNEGHEIQKRSGKDEENGMEMEGRKN